MSWYFNHGVRTPAGDAAYLNPPGSGERRRASKAELPIMAKPSRYNSERFSHMAGAQVTPALHLWGYVAEIDERWQTTDYFYGSSMRAGDWLLVSQRDGDRCGGFLCVVASVDPTVLARVA